MAHNLYRNTMAFVGAKPWHFLGEEFTEKFTAQEAAERTGIAFEVRKEQLFRQRMVEGELVLAPADSWATVNCDTDEALGIVGADYCPVQFKEIAAFFDIIAGEFGARFVTAGAIGKGEKLWLLAELEDYFEVVPGDRVDPYLMFSNGHDGQTKAQARATKIRTVCQNTFNAAVRGSAAFISLRHTTNVGDRIKIAANLMRSYNEDLKKTGESFSKLAAVRIDDVWLDQYINHLFGDPKEQPEGAARTICLKKQSKFNDLLDKGMGVKLPGVYGTAWWALNAAVEYADFDFPMRKNTDRTNSILFGSAAAFKQKATDKAFDLVGVPA